MHHFGSSSNRVFVVPPGYEAHSRAYRQAVLVGAEHGATHSHLTLNELAPGGDLGMHMHSFEEGAYLLGGQALVGVDDETLRLRPGDFFVAKAGMMHGWRAAGSDVVRWLQLSMPQPKPPGAVRDTFFSRSRRVADGGVPVASDGVRALAGHFDAANKAAADPSRTASVGPGVFLQWMIDEVLGARHHRMLFIEYQPGAAIALHDHTFEETYFLLDGEIEAVLDGETHLVKPGDVVWTGVGCVHAFANRSGAPVRWIETFAPQPPAENVFRFVEEWAGRGRAVEDEDVKGDRAG
jgi:quercetin dioxygenase-like cupin family protein